MKPFSLLCWLLVATSFCGLPARLLAQESQPTSPRRTIGAPQVLEIPTAQDAAPAPESVSLPPSSPMPESPPEIRTTHDPVPQPEELVASPQRNYLGVLYATAEEGQSGVKVLSVVAGSPAARAGFQGADAPTAGQSDLVKAAIVVLAMSPAGPFAIPLAIAHDLYSNRQSPGDLITSVGDRPVRDALEFNEELRRYKPGDTVAFSIMRAGKLQQITVQLEEEPA
ncbi:MAG: PDZ domain-containing protein [Candidatus Binatia bacterium]